MKIKEHSISLVIVMQIMKEFIVNKRCVKRKGQKEFFQKNVNVKLVGMGLIVRKM